MKILNVVGARPNLVKISPLLKAMKEHPNIEAVLVHTGQHYDDKMSEVFFRQMGIPEPDVNLEVGSGSHGCQTADILKRIERVLVETRPDLVLVVGDVNSTVAASLAAVKLGIPVAHVEAGLRSFDRTMPEEVNRVVTDVIADYLFVTEESGVDNLIREGRPRDRIYFVGNVMIDALRSLLPAAAHSRVLERLGLHGNIDRFAVLTLHRPSNVDHPEQFTHILQIIEEVAERLPIIFPIHPRTQTALVGLGRHSHPNVKLVPPVGYVDFLSLLSRADVVLTDSGGIQEETTVLGIPCLTLRENTERPVTVNQGTNEIVGLDRGKICLAVENILAGKWKSGMVPALWDGHAAERIVHILEKEVSSIRRQTAVTALDALPLMISAFANKSSSAAMSKFAGE